jgi:hypothetical protein
VDDYPYISSAFKVRDLDVVLGGNADFDHGYLGAPVPGPLVNDTISDFTDDQMRSRKYRLNFNIKKHSKKYQGLNFGVNGNLMFNSGPMTMAWLDDTAGFYRGYPGAVYLQDQFIFYLDPSNIYTGEGTKHSIKARILYNNSQMTNNQSILSTMLYGDYQFNEPFMIL